MARCNKTTRSVRELGEPIRVFEALDERDEADFVTSQIRSLLSDGAVSSLADIGVLFRTNMQSRALEEALGRARLPHRVVGSLRFYARREVKDVLAYLRLLHNRHDAASIERILNVPPRGLGPKTMAKIDAHSRMYKCSMLDSLRRLSGLVRAEVGAEEEGEGGGWGKLSARKKMAMAELYGALRELHLSVANSTPEQVMKGVVERFGFEEYLLAQDKGRQRWANVVELLVTCLAPC
jgi:DNA helicase-2/ATP-dependent DNA helicase PcrA